MLTQRKRNFVIEYCKDFDAPSAYIRAGFSAQSAASGCHRLLNDPEMVSEIEERKEVLARVAGLNPEWVLHKWILIASANPADLVQIRVFRCRSCWEISGNELPPNPACESCGGVGITRTTLTPTSELRGPAKQLYAGAQQTKDGVKILMRDQNEALKNLADYLGMLNKSKGEISGPGGGPLQVLTATVKELSDIQLLAIAAGRDLELGVGLGVQTIDALPSHTEQGV